MSNINWMPCGSLQNLQRRAEIVGKIRGFFAERSVLEVDTPTMAEACGTDVHLAPLTVDYCFPDGQRTLYMQTSPEFAMKRLLAAGFGDIYQICKAYRDGEAGRLHRGEFTILEWYRVGFDHHDLMDEMDLLLQTVIDANPATRHSYRDLFLQYCDLDPHIASVDDCRDCIKRLDIEALGDLHCDKVDDYLQLIMNHIIEPNLGFYGPCFVYDYPMSQAALARIDNGVAQRFEVYINGIELANGFHELTDANEQAERFKQDLIERERLGYPLLPIDEKFLRALQHGLPDCAGVALGVDRLIAVALGVNEISSVLSF